MLMNALQVVQPRHFSLVQTPIPHLTSDQRERLVVRTSWVSMCGSDIPFFTGNKRHKTYPLPLGAPIHECSGQVVESTSHLFQPGEQVVAIPDGDQGLAEYFVAQAAKTVRLPAGLEGNEASCLIQPLSTVMNAIDRLGDIAGKSVAVLGLGSIGQLFCWLLKIRGAERIIGIDPLAQRGQVAGAFGATQTYSLRGIEVVHAVRQKLIDWEAPDICIEAVGHQMETLSDSFELVRKNGAVVAFGVPDQPVYAIEFEIFFRKNLELLAVVTPDWKKYLEKACSVFLEYHEELETLVTHRLPIREAEKAFMLYERHEDGILKALIKATSW
jgi:threonine dehydrogenase-like Zn-dependent dehydrogenase